MADNTTNTTPTLRDLLGDDVDLTFTTSFKTRFEGGADQYEQTVTIDYSSATLADVLSGDAANRVVRRQGVYRKAKDEETFVKYLTENPRVTVAWDEMGSTPPEMQLSKIEKMLAALSPSDRAALLAQLSEADEADEADA